MLQNRSMPASTVIPVLAYPSVPEAVAWLSAAFGFTLRLERCATTEDLVAILPSYAEALLKKLDRDATRALVERTRELLASARG